MHLAVGDAHEHRDTAVQIKQRVQLHCPFAFAEASPRKQGQAQIDGSGVDRVSAVLEVLAEGFAGIALAGAGDEDLREIRECPCDRACRDNSASTLRYHAGSRDK